MLTLNHISKTFNPGTVNEHTALRDISLHVATGEFVIIVGGNGSGKSTLLNTVAGAIAADSGTVMIDGMDVTGLPEHKRAGYIGRVFQDPLTGTAGHMTIEENLALAGRRGKKRGLGRGLTDGERAGFRTLLAQLELGLEDRMATRVNLLSGGQRQAVTLLMATLLRPKLLLLDEHTAALDPKTAAKVLSLSAKLVKEMQLTTLMITHNMADAIQYGDRLIMMSEGQPMCDLSGAEKEGLTVASLLSRFAIPVSA